MNNKTFASGGGKPDPKFIWHERTLRELRRRLTQERDEHRHAAAEPLVNEVADRAETAGDEAERDVIFAELSAEENALADVEAALLRLHAGTYGICEETGNPIPADRLRAVPWTRYTREAAERHERHAR